MKYIYSLFPCDLCILQYGPLGGALFADYGTDLGSGPTVPGRFYLFGKFTFLTLFFYFFLSFFFGCSLKMMK